MQKFKRKLFKYPLVFIFFIFLIGFFIFDSLLPSKEYSQEENRNLQQYPAVTINSLANNSWMVDYEDYVKDQFALRDSWISLKSNVESFLLKTENNDILFGKDDYLFTKTWSINDETRYENNVYALVKMAQRIGENANIMIIPSASNILSEKLPQNVPLIDENYYLDDIFAQLETTSANVIDVRDTLNEHEDDYIFYRTDHHWTSEGAFLSYEYYANLKGKEVFNKSSTPYVNVEDFYGTHYSKARNSNVVPDTLTYYELDNNLDVLRTDENMETYYEPGPIYDISKFEQRDKYAAFLRGNNGYSVLSGSGEGKILVVKDSYANCFIPYLTASYEQIGIVDFRENRMPLDDIMESEGFDEVLFLYSFDAFISDLYFGSAIVGSN